MALGWDVLLQGDSYSGGRMRWGRAEIRGGVHTGVQLGGVRVAVELSWGLDPEEGSLVLVPRTALIEHFENAPAQRTVDYKRSKAASAFTPDEVARGVRGEAA